MSRLAHRILAAFIVWALVIGAGAIVGCGKYGKPIRRPSEPKELVSDRADGGEKRYTFSK